MSKKYDCVVIGAGTNGETTAAYLGIAGKNVCVLEKNDFLGGCAHTKELMKGYKSSPAAYVISLYQQEIINDLNLKRHGLKILIRDPSSFTPDLNGPGLILGSDKSRNKIEIGRYSKEDAEKFPEYEEYLENIVKQLEPIIDSVPPTAALSGRKLSNLRKLKEIIKGGSLAKKIYSLGQAFPDAFDFLSGAATPILDNWFESDILKATLATDAIIGSHTSPSQLGSAYVLFHHVMGGVDGKRGVWGYVQGGMGGLADSLASACKSYGVDIYKNKGVEEILLNDNGSVWGVRTSNEDIKSSVVVSSVSPDLTFKKMVGYGNLPEVFVKRLDKIIYEASCGKVNVITDEIPVFKCGKREVTGSDLMGTIHIPNTLKGIEDAFDQSKNGFPSEKPILEMVIPSILDSTLVPRESKHHVVSVLVQYLPLTPKDSSWDDIRDEFTKKCIKIIDEHAPGFENSVLYKQLITPEDLERDLGLTGGDIFHGAMIPSQMFSNRYVPGYSDHRTPIKGLYICGSAAHPGGGVTGIPGRNCAKEILKDI